MTRLRLAIAAPHGLLWLAVVWWYPAMRGDVLLWLYTGAELAGGVFVVGCLYQWRRQATGRQQVPRPDRKGPLPEPALGRDHPHGPPGADLDAVAGWHDSADAPAADSDRPTERPETQQTVLEQRQIGADVGGEELHGGNIAQPTLTVICALALTSASLATTLLPALQGPAMIAGWPVVVTVWCVALGIVLGVQGWKLLGKDTRR